MNDISSATPAIDTKDDLGWAGIWMGSATGWLALLALVQGAEFPNTSSPSWITAAWVMGHVLVLAGIVTLNQKRQAPGIYRTHRVHTFLLGAGAGLGMGAFSMALLVAWLWFGGLLPSPLISVPMVP